MIKVLAISLEKTIVSPELEPRPGLRKFLEFCVANFPEIRWFTSIPCVKVQGIIKLLFELDVVPPEALNLSCVEWTGSLKNMEFIGLPLNEVLVVDSNAFAFLPSQFSQLLLIPEYDPQSVDDCELEKIELQIQERLKNV